MSSDGCCRGVNQCPRDTKRHMGEEQLVIFFRDCGLDVIRNAGSQAMPMIETAERTVPLQARIVDP